ncbi:hypothetical protein [Virgibacillus sp. MG-45]|uniref:hypothetical protein n=1 Tax=Virgibacillus sp. MG-45 TaxID=3102791 RepID=UPI002EDB5FC9
MTKMHCPECKKEYQGEDLVYMDGLNRVRHVQCGDKWYVHKDTGTLRDIERIEQDYYGEFTDAGMSELILKGS